LILILRATNVAFIFLSRFFFFSFFFFILFFLVDRCIANVLSLIEIICTETVLSLSTQRSVLANAKWDVQRLFWLPNLELNSFCQQSSLHIFTCLDNKTRAVGPSPNSLLHHKRSGTGPWGCRGAGAPGDYAMIRGFACYSVPAVAAHPDGAGLFFHLAFASSASSPQHGYQEPSAARDLPYILGNLRDRYFKGSDERTWHPIC